MEITCSNCHKEVGTQEQHTAPGSFHVLCPECGDYFLAEYGGVSLGETLDRFDEPVVIFNKDVRVVACNRNYLRQFKETAPKAFGLLSGEFVDCPNAKLPGGCGQTPHCPSCDIRGAVNTTLSTGNPIERIKAVLQSPGGGHSNPRVWSVSTRKVGELVQFTFR